MESRMPHPMPYVPELGPAAEALTRAAGNGTVPGTTLGLVHLRTGQLVDSAYMTLSQARKLREGGESEERVTAVASWRDALCFTDAERAALALTDAVLLPATGGERVPDGLYAEAARHYDAKALWTLVLGLGQASFWAAITVVGKPIPGVPFGEQWTPAMT
jgi:alkylhydroperoxidase family enzyme